MKSRGVSKPQGWEEKRAAGAQADNDPPTQEEGGSSGHGRQARRSLHWVFPRLLRPPVTQVIQC